MSLPPGTSCIVTRDIFNSMNKLLVQAWIARAQFLASTTASSITTTGGLLRFGRSLAILFCLNKLFEERMSKIFIPETSLSETGRLTASLQNAVVPWKPTEKNEMKVVDYCRVISLVRKGSRLVNKCVQKPEMARLPSHLHASVQTTELRNWLRHRTILCPPIKK